MEEYLPSFIAVPGETYSRLWHFILSVAAVNNLIQLYVLAKSRRSKGTWNIRMTCTCIFTVVCAFRSFLPRVDAERLCFWDLGVIQTPFVGRSCATVAEIAFAYQGTRYWERVIGTTTNGSMIVANIAWFLCSFAQGLCWTGVLTTNNFWHACENSLWGLSPFLLSVGGFIAVVKKQKCERNLQFLQLFCFGAPIFVAYLATHDVPMYIRKWQEGVGGGVDLAIMDGLKDSLTCNVSRSDDLWTQEMSWMSGYFIFGPIIMMTLEKWDKELKGGVVKAKAKAGVKKSTATSARGRSTSRGLSKTPVKTPVESRAKSRGKSPASKPSPRVTRSARKKKL